MIFIKFFEKMFHQTFEEIIHGECATKVSIFCSTK